ncbi:hypothetical protein Lfu02_77120 [Longispora fulva]|uniref:Diguanylate cyclase (GGDEF)-like protein n=1 Tax=Longispora fulva TaxID=619741 RepID=A0A8J7GNX5_9ACTN|nr:GGDEF domain-containing protein [Longispora fulva]MBG6136169.1 diguanylate cyclase (GGDEF)-like protein [Longispora fulva]GIG63340.1 hypothetical protein Lfu02_77120 [Longispora fulva]
MSQIFLAVFLMVVLPGAALLMAYREHVHNGRIHTLQHQLHLALWAASHDALTKLLNRRGGLQQLTHALSGEQRVSVVMLDLDKFKAVNDNLGHHGGDKLLVQVATRLEALGGRVADVARLGGDEFFLIVNGIGDEARIAAHAAWRAIADEPFLIDGHKLRVTASIGVASHQLGADAIRMITNADYALFTAKHSGAPVCVHTVGEPPIGNRPAVRRRDRNT